MNEANEHEEDEIVDLDSCSKKKSVLLGSLVGVLLSLVPISFLILILPYTLAGLAAVAHFTKRHTVTISSGTGAKIGALAAVIGMVPILILTISVFMTGGIDEQFEQLRHQYIKEAYENGSPQLAEAAEGLNLDDAMPLILIGVGFLLTAVSLLEGAIGGLLGAAMYKRGNLAK